MGHGQLITYDPATGNGIVSAEGTRHQFSIERWKSDSVPKIGLMVEVHIQPDGESAEFHPISDVKSTLTVNANKLKQGVVGKLATSIIERLGWPLTAVYLFFIGVVFLVPVVGGVAEQTIWDVSGYTWYSKILLLFAMVSVFSPWLRINSKLWRALATPALTGIYFGIQLADLSREIQKMAEAGPNEGDGLFGSVLAMAAQYMQVQWEGYAVFLISSLAITILAFHRFGFNTTTSANTGHPNGQISPTEKTMSSLTDD